MMHVRNADTDEYYGGKVDTMVDVDNLTKGDEKGTKYGKPFWGVLVSKIIDEYGNRDNFWQPVTNLEAGVTAVRPGEHRKVYVYEDGKADVPSGGDKDTQIAQLRAQLAAKDQEDKDAAKDAYIAQMQSQLTSQNSNVVPLSDTPNTDAERVVS